MSVDYALSTPHTPHPTPQSPSITNVSMYLCMYACISICAFRHMYMYNNICFTFHIISIGIDNISNLIDSLAERESVCLFRMETEHSIILCLTLSVCHVWLFEPIANAKQHIIKWFGAELNSLKCWCNLFQLNGLRWLKNRSFSCKRMPRIEF